MDGPLFLMSPSAGWLSWLSYLARGGATDCQVRAAAAYPPTARWFEMDGVPVTDLGGVPDPAKSNTADGMQPVWDPRAKIPAGRLAGLKISKGNPTAEAHLANWRENRAKVPGRFAEGPRANGSVLVLGSGPSLREVIPYLAGWRERGVVVVAVNQVPQLIDARLIDYYVVMSPNAVREWWDVPGLARAVKVAYIGCHPSIVEGPSAGIQWYGVHDGNRANAEAFAACPALACYQTSRTVAGPALQLALSLGNVCEVVLAGFDLSFPNGDLRPTGERAPAPDLMVPDCQGRPVGTDALLFQDALRLSIWSAFLAYRSVSVVNWGRMGLLGSFKVRARDGRDLTIRIEPTRISKPEEGE
jgi:hypothetical protein